MENSIGSRTEPASDEDDEKEQISHNFCGEMSALHFVAISDPEVMVIHKYLCSIVGKSDIHSLVPSLEEGMKSIPEKDPALASRIFMLVSPACVHGSIRPGDTLFRIVGPKDIYSPIANVLEGTRVHHNHPLQDVFVSISGAKCLLPFLQDLTRTEVSLFSQRYFRTHTCRNELVGQVVGIMAEGFSLSQDAARLFVNRDGGFEVLGHLLDQLAGKENGGLDLGVHSALEDVLRVLKSQLTDLDRPFVEQVLFNMDIWRHSTPDVQARVVAKLGNRVLALKTHAEVVEGIDTVMDAVEVYTQETETPDRKARIEQLSQIVVLAAKSDFDKAANSSRYYSGELMNRVASYANVHYIRRLKNYVEQVYHVMTILHEINQTRNIPAPSQE